jgi:hypothetical protein
MIKISVDQLKMLERQKFGSEKGKNELRSVKSILR